MTRLEDADDFTHYFNTTQRLSMKLDRIKKHCEFIQSDYRPDEIPASEIQTILDIIRSDMGKYEGTMRQQTLDYIKEALGSIIQSPPRDSNFRVDPAKVAEMLDEVIPFFEAYKLSAKLQDSPHHLRNSLSEPERNAYLIVKWRLGLLQAWLPDSDNG